MSEIVIGRRAAGKRPIPDYLNWNREVAWDGRRWPSIAGHECTTCAKIARYPRKTPIDGGAK